MITGACLSLETHTEMGTQLPAETFPRAHSPQLQHGNGSGDALISKWQEKSMIRGLLDGFLERTAALFLGAVNPRRGMWKCS